MKTLIMIASIFFCCIYYCCKNGFDKKDVYIMPKDISVESDERAEYYLSYNFIIDTGSHIYFFQREAHFNPCGFVDWWQRVRIPAYIDLKPKDIIEIPSVDLEKFIQTNILDAKGRLREVMICSPFDTVVSPELSRMMIIFQDTVNHIQWKMRKTTQEENYVLDYKKAPDSYPFGHHEIKWDSTKTLFPEVVSKIMRDEIDSIIHSYEKKVPAINMPDTIINVSRFIDSIRFTKLANALHMKPGDLFALVE